MVSYASSNATDTTTGTTIISALTSPWLAQNPNKHSDVDGTFERGIIFWINNLNDNTNLSHKLINIEIPKEYNHDGIVLMDNNKMGFIFDSISYVRNKYRSSNIEFSYFLTGMNNDDVTNKSGKILPVQYLSSNIIPFRVQKKGKKKTTLVLCTNDNFEKAELLKMMGLAKNISLNYQVKTNLVFPDYNKTDHQHTVDLVKQSFVDDTSFVDNLKVISHPLFF